MNRKNLPAPRPRYEAIPKKEGGFNLFLKTIGRNFQVVAVNNAANLVNAIFLVVSTLLLVLGQAREAIFLASVLVLNVVIGIIQDLRAKVALEKLQALSAPRIVRIAQDGKREEISLENVLVEDTLFINIGDQVPADGRMVESRGLEINEALISGESNYAHKNVGDQILAGSIVMAGSGLMRVEAMPGDSYVARMTETVKKYEPNPSPIQEKLNLFIKYMSYLLLLIIAYVVAHGLRTNDLLVSMVQDIGALTGTLVPQGLVLSITVFFAYGAIKLLKDNVLMQEINATEKLGRIKNLCIDKTGTLTERKPVLEETIIYDGYDSDQIGRMLAGYICATRDTSEVAVALQTRAALSFPGTVVASLPFSSNRKYGIAWLHDGSQDVVAILGAPDILMDYFADEDGKRLVMDSVESFAGKAKRLILMAQAAGLSEGEQISGKVLRPVALFVLFDPLRPGVEKIIDFFQRRDVRIRMISGDGPRTVQAVATLAGMKYADIVVTGQEMESWDDVEYEERVPAFHLYARVKPEQKEKIITLLKKGGYTAMVGDGANDALAMKKADLGVAMFDGAPATRQIAQVVLLDNSFATLPKGVKLAESVILNIELVVNVFFNKVAVGLVLFLSLAFMGYGYPLSPSDMTIINYFTIWLPMAYWTFFPVSNADFNPQLSRMGKTLLFAAISGVMTAAAASIIFILEPRILRYGDSNFLVMMTMIALGYWYFVLAPLNYGSVPDKKNRLVMGILAAGIALLIAAAVFMPQLKPVFMMRPPSLTQFLLAFPVIGIFGYAQYLIATHWFWRRN